MSKQVNPAGRVDVLVERASEIALRRMQGFPLIQRLASEAGIDIAGIIKDQISRKLKRERITDVKSLRRALRR